MGKESDPPPVGQIVLGDITGEGYELMRRVPDSTGRVIWQWYAPDATPPRWEHASYGAPDEWYPLPGELQQDI